MTYPKQPAIALDSVVFDPKNWMNLPLAFDHDDIVQAATKIRAMRHE